MSNNHNLLNNREGLMKAHQVPRSRMSQIPTQARLLGKLQPRNPNPQTLQLVGEELQTERN